jgi:hypothetical protein
VLAGICDVPSIATANAALEEFEAKVSYRAPRLARPSAARS